MAAAIQIENLGKHFRRYHRDRPPTLKETILSGWRSSKSVEQFWALRHVDLDVSRGEMVGIVGQNGAGKSTLLQMVGGVGTPDEGRVRVEGRIGALLDLGAGFSPDLTGGENIDIAGVAAGLTRGEVRQRFDRIVAFAELEEAIDNPVRTYSSGMQMRLGFSVAVNTEPEILLIDEFLSVGDLAFQAKCLDRIQEMKAQGCAIMLISHSLGQITDLCDRAVWLRRGEVVVEGLPEVVAGQYAVNMRSETRRRTPNQAPSLASSGCELQVNRNRFGSMEAEISAVRLTPGPRIGSGEPLRVEIDVTSEQPVQAVNFNVSVTRKNDGQVCLDLNTTDEAQMAALSGAATIVLSLRRLDLAGGDYFVNVGIFRADWEYAYDYHWEVYPLSIEGPENPKGVLCPPFRWSIGRRPAV
ncbi:ABC transporter ATP-binding protein [Thiocapsa sp.]|uniref:ABC transporter ATP-binding protein n=1 Tax=Thiocapsa sp. TaxID=2024551 RepID=UPI001BCF9554|nr:ABC transporter ATP-binding protein [Thiocapsa sp.]